MYKLICLVMNLAFIFVNQFHALGLVVPCKQDLSLAVVIGWPDRKSRVAITALGGHRLYLLVW